MKADEKHVTNGIIKNLVLNIEYLNAVINHQNGLLTDEELNGVSEYTSQKSVNFNGNLLDAVRIFIDSVSDLINAKKYEISDINISHALNQDEDEVGRILEILAKESRVINESG